MNSPVSDKLVQKKVSTVHYLYILLLSVVLLVFNDVVSFIESQLQPKTQLSLSIKPSGAEVFIDNQRVYKKEFALEYGQYNLRVTRPEFEPYETTLALDSPVDTRTVELKPSSVPVLISTTPIGAEIIVVGLGEFVSGTALPPGEYNVQLAYKNYKPRAEVISVSNINNQFHFALERDTRILQLTGLPKNAEVTVNDKPYMPRNNYQVGALRVEVRHPEFFPFSETLIHRGEPLRINLKRQWMDVTFDVSPGDASITFLDNQPFEYRKGQQFLVGNQKIKVHRMGFSSIDTEITIKEQDNHFAFRLSPLTEDFQYMESLLSRFYSAYRLFIESCYSAGGKNVDLIYSAIRSAYYYNRNYCHKTGHQRLARELLKFSDEEIYVLVKYAQERFWLPSVLLKRAAAYMLAEIDAVRFDKRLRPYGNPKLSVMPERDGETGILLNSGKILFDKDAYFNDWFYRRGPKVTQKIKVVAEALLDEKYQPGKKLNVNPLSQATRQSQNIYRTLYNSAFYRAFTDSTGWQSTKEIENPDSRLEEMDRKALQEWLSESESQ